MPETNYHMIQSCRKFSICTQNSSGICWTCVIKSNLFLALAYEQIRNPKDCSGNYRDSIKLNFSLPSQIELSNKVCKIHSSII